MSVPIWVSDITTTFWKAVGETEPFPRTLRQPIARAVPLSVVWLPGLSVNSVMTWLTRFGIACNVNQADRPIRACLVARRGVGLAFLDGSDSDDEQRFSLGHELGHFLRDYWHVREKTARRLGSTALAILDGDRRPTSEERLQALLRRTSLGFYVHLLARDDCGRPQFRAIEDSEQCADRLALELLAPAVHVVTQYAKCQPGEDSLTDLLQVEFGLPSVQARQYARTLLPEKKLNPLLKRLSSVS